MTERAEKVSGEEKYRDLKQVVFGKECMNPQTLFKLPTSTVAGKDIRYRGRHRKLRDGRG